MVKMEVGKINNISVKPVVFSSTNKKGVTSPIEEKSSTKKKAIIATAILVPAALAAVIYGIRKGKVHMPEGLPNGGKKAQDAPQDFSEMLDNIRGTRKSPEFSPKKLDEVSRNGAIKPDAWSKEDMKAYYEQLEVSQKEKLLDNIRGTRKSLDFSPKKLDEVSRNGAIKPDAWPKGDMKAYYEQLERNQQTIEQIKRTRKSPEFSPEKLDKYTQNGAIKHDAWTKEDMSKYYKELEEFKQLEEKIGKEEAEFIKNYNEPLPSYEERFNAFKNDIRIEYGDVFANSIKELKEWIKDDKNYIKGIFYRKPEIKKLCFEFNLKNYFIYNPERFYYIQKALNELDKRNLRYDKNSIFFLSDEIIKTIAEGKFTSPFGYEALGHNFAYSINGALRTGKEVDDVLVAILDEGFKNVDPLERKELVYRQVVGNSVDNSIDFINKLIKSKKGDTFIDKGYSYSTYYENCATSCNGIKDKGAPWIEMKISVPKGAKVSNGSGYEQCEMLFPRNAEFRIVEEAKIVKQTKDGDSMEMLVEYIPKL
jgi:hypothetical protein